MNFSKSAVIMMSVALPLLATPAMARDMTGAAASHALTGTPARSAPVIELASATLPRHISQSQCDEWAIRSCYNRVYKNDRHGRSQAFQPCVDEKHAFCMRLLTR